MDFRRSDVGSAGLAHPYRPGFSHAFLLLECFPRNIAGRDQTDGSGLLAGYLFIPSSSTSPGLRRSEFVVRVASCEPQLAGVVT